VDALAARVEQALEQERLDRFAIGGGVAANSELRGRLRVVCEDLGVRLWVPATELCTDNAAMIAAAARFCRPIDYPEYLALDAAARMP
jgi:N6-L-threonylcarbamoyladenine synthase